MPKNKKSNGSIRAKAGMLAKAGRRKPPATKGKHTTTPEERRLGKYLQSLGLTRKLLKAIDDAVDKRFATKKPKFKFIDNLSELADK